jgi:hypothetical protein
MRSLSRNVVITGLMILLIAIGVAGSITTYALLSVLSANPLPSKSQRLFVPQITGRHRNSALCGEGIRGYGRLFSHVFGAIPIWRRVESGGRC